MSEFIVLTCYGKQYAYDVLLSPEDHAWAANRGNWFVTHGARSKGKRYAVRSEGGRLIFLHKVVLARAFQLPPSPFHTIGDHRNGDSLDNRRSNLRWATPQMNARNLFGFITQQLEFQV